jgi:hypothetical protein
MKLTLAKKEMSESEKELTQIFHDDRDNEVKVIQTSEYPLTLNSKDRPRDFWDKQQYKILYNGKEISILGKSRSELINVTGLKNDELLSMDKTISNYELDKFLSTQNLPETTSNSVFLHGKREDLKTDSDKNLENRFLSKAFTKKVFDNLINGKDIIIPVRRNNEYTERAGHWVNVRLNYNKDTNELSSVLENSTAEINSKLLSTIKEEYTNEIIKPISNYLKDELELEHTAKEMEYCENRQYGNMGCGITAIDNIKNNLSKIESLHLKNDDQIVETKVIDFEGFGFNSLEELQAEYNLPQNQLEEKNLKGTADSINNKVNKGSVINESLLRVDIVSTISTLQLEKLYNFEKELIEKYDKGSLILDSTPAISFKELNNLDKIQATADESDEEFAARLQEAEIRAGGLQP